MALKLRTLLQSSAMISAFRAMNASLIRCSDVRNLTTTIAGNAEERGQFDIEVSHHHIVDTPLSPIEQVALGGSISAEVVKPS